jgi:hypothetical protein
MFEPATPIYLAAGAHSLTFKGFTSKAQYYRSSPAVLIGSVLSAWGGWTEQGGSAFGEGLFAYDTNVAAPPSNNTSGVVGFL